MKLVASGCSFTYGHGLTDCFIPPLGHGPDPSKFAWPSVVADLLNIECVNVSTPGGGNMRIIKQLLEVDLDETDIVTVLWSYSTRAPEFTTTKTLNNGEWDEIYMKNIFNYSSAHDLYLKQLISIYTFTKYLESKKVKILYQFIDRIDNIVKESIHYPLYYKLWNEIKKYDETTSTFDKVQTDVRDKQIVGFALDGRHPNEDWHKKLGIYVHRRLTADKLI